MNIDQFFCQALENAINDLLKNELTVFLDYEKWDPIGYNSGNSRNGYYHRTVKNKYGTMDLIIPRDRNGSFHQQTVPAYKQTSDSLETTIIQLYQKGITKREIMDFLEKMYGHHYSPATISNMAKLVQEDVKAFHTRSVKEDYVVIYADATYIPVRRDCVRKEALHVLIGIDP